MNLTMRNSSLILLIFFVSMMENLTEGAETVKISLQMGEMIGLKNYTWTRKEFYSFRGIPYAQKPVGPLRFKTPEPLTSWEGVYDATKGHCYCSQRDLETRQYIGQDDCLYLNVYTPAIPEAEDQDEQLKPVMFFIHGGAYITGSGNADFYGPEYLLVEDIVLVTINYRLGLLGFLSFNDSSYGIPGNAGLKDQLLALKWVRWNIKSFGGNPDNVTIFGESAGGASVHFHMLSEKSRGLFHKAILQSGSLYNPWNSGCNSNGEVLIKYLGLEGRTTAEVLEYIQSLPPSNLIELQERLITENGCVIGPTLETYIDEETILNVPLKDFIENSSYNIPVMAGYMDNESLILELERIIQHRAVKYLTVEEIMPYYLKQSENYTTYLEKIKKFYFMNEEKVFTNSFEYIQFMSDNDILWGIYKLIDKHLKLTNRPIFLYRFSAETRLNVAKRWHPLTTEMDGATHGDELGYLFKTKYNPEIEPDSVEEKLVTSMVKLWTDFAKYGNPTQEMSPLNWAPVAGPDSLNYLHIGKNIDTRSKPPEYERLLFGKELPYV